MSEELLPCPFCGGEAIDSEIEPGNWRIGCNNVQCRGDWFASKFYPTKAAAITAWNTRTELTAKPTRDKLGFAYCGECGWNIGAATAPFRYCSHCGRKVEE